MLLFIIDYPHWGGMQDLGGNFDILYLQTTCMLQEVVVLLEGGGGWSRAAGSIPFCAFVFFVNSVRYLFASPLLLSISTGEAEPGCSLACYFPASFLRYTYFDTTTPLLFFWEAFFIYLLFTLFIVSFFLFLIFLFHLISWVRGIWLKR